MLNVLAGRLSEDLEVNKSKTGKDVCSTGIYVWPGNKGIGKNAEARDAVLVRVEAWGENAHELAKYGKGETIQFVGRAIDVKYKPKGLERELTVMGYDIKKIDHSKTILSEFNEILNDYVNKDKQKNFNVNKENTKSMDTPKNITPQPSLA